MLRMWIASTRLLQDMLLAVTESGSKHRTTMPGVPVLYHTLESLAPPCWLLYPQHCTTAGRKQSMSCRATAKGMHQAGPSQSHTPSQWLRCAY